MSRRAAARLEADFPQYNPLVTMAEGAIALAEEARSDPKVWPDAVVASEKVAAFIMPKLKAVEHSGEVRTSVVLFKSDEEL